MANVHTPDRKDYIVVPDNELETYLAQGYISDEQAMEEQKALAAQLYQEWLADPETEEERFAILRQACEIRLSQTDYAMTSDYPISDESKTALLAYRKALRELNHQQGAPWDGGGELTPWPEMPVITKNIEEDA